MTRSSGATLSSCTDQDAGGDHAGMRERSIAGLRLHRKIRTTILNSRSSGGRRSCTGGRLRSPHVAANLRRDCCTIR